MTPTRVPSKTHAHPNLTCITAPSLPGACPVIDLGVAPPSGATPAPEGAKERPILASTSAAIVAIILHVFGPIHGQHAVSVARCESRLQTTARNGDHLGLFQLGAWERRHYAHGRYRTALDQTRAAYRYFVATGRDWGAWSCQP